VFARGSPEEADTTHEIKNPAVVAESDGSAPSDELDSAELQPLPTIKTLAELHSISNEYDPGNHVRLLAALEGIPAETIAEWYRQLRSYRTQHLQVTAALADQLARIDPERSLELAQNGDSQSAIFLIQAHPERAGEFLDSTMKPRVRFTMIRTHLKSLWDGNFASTLAAHEAFMKKHGTEIEQLNYERYNRASDALTSNIANAPGSPSDLIAWNVKLQEQNGDGSSHMIPITPILEKFNSPQAALAFFNENGLEHYDQSLRARILGGIGGQWAISDPVAAAAWIAGLPEDVRREVVGRTMNESPSRELFDALPEEFQDAQMAGNVARKWIQLDPSPEAVTWFLEHSAGANADMFVTTLRTLVSHNPEAVTQHLLDNPESLIAMQSWAGNNVYRELVASSPESAPQLVEAVTSIHGGTKSLFHGWATADLQGAIAMVDTLTDPEQRLAAIRGVVVPSYRANFAETIEWARGLQGNESTAAMTLLANHAATDQVLYSEAATEWLNQPGIDIHPNDVPFAQITNVLISSSPEEATEWIGSLDDEGMRDKATLELSRQWAEHDPAGMSEWLLEVPEGDVRDEVIGNLLTHITDDPAGSFIWATTISDSNSRSSRLEDVVRRWGQHDPDAAREAIADAETLDPQQQQQLLQQLEEQ